VGLCCLDVTGFLIIMGVKVMSVQQVNVVVRIKRIRCDSEWHFGVFDVLCSCGCVCSYGLVKCVKRSEQSGILCGVSGVVDMCLAVTDLCVVCLLWCY